MLQTSAMVVLSLCPRSKAVAVANLSELVHVHDLLNDGAVYLIWVLDELV